MKKEPGRNLQAKKRISEFTDDLDSEKKRIMEEPIKSQDNPYFARESTRNELYSLKSESGNRFLRIYKMRLKITGNEETEYEFEFETNDEEKFDKVFDKAHGIFGER